MPTRKIIYNLSVSKPGQRLRATPGIHHVFVIKRNRVSVDILEAEDTLFNFKSAVFLPGGVTEADEKDQGQATDEQKRVGGLAVICGIFRYNELCNQRGQSKHMLITGHTDTVGSDNYNAKLSLKRAEVIWSLIEGGVEGRKKFVEICSKENVAEDQQEILKWLSKKMARFDAVSAVTRDPDDSMKWNYDPEPMWRDLDPGKIDGKIGNNTQTAVNNFKRVFKVRFPPQDGNVDIAVRADLADFKEKKSTWGVFDTWAWEAVYEIYQAEIQFSLLQDGLDLFEIRKNLKWVDDQKKAVGCGETWPIDSRGTDNYRSQSNRRVEILFYDPYELYRYTPGDAGTENEKSFLPCHDGTCAQGDCHIFKNIERPGEDTGSLGPKLEWKYIPLNGNGEIEELAVRLVILPETARKMNYKFRLFNTGGKVVYDQTKTVKDDMNQGDHYIDLVYDGVINSQSYSLEVDPGKDGEPYLVLENYFYTY